MNTLKKLCTYALVISLIFAFANCGGSDSFLQGTYSVKDVSILSDHIAVGEVVRVEVFFETKYEFSGGPDGLDLFVRLPRELSYVLGSARIYDNLDDNSDPYTPDDVVRCLSGETILFFSFSDSDLSGRELSGGPADYGIKFEARGQERTPVTYVGAIAGRDENYRCAESFPSEEDEAVEIL